MLVIALVVILLIAAAFIILSPDKPTTRSGPFKPSHNKAEPADSSGDPREAAAR
jgi:hypothetical protein